MNVATLGLCSELYRLSGWGDGEKPKLKEHIITANESRLETYPAYDLGYLLRKLEGFDVRLHYSNTWRLWGVFAQDSKGEDHDSPENAAAKVCIELFKLGVLTPEKPL